MSMFLRQKKPYRDRAFKNLRSRCFIDFFQSKSKSYSFIIFSYTSKVARASASAVCARWLIIPKYSVSF